MTFSINGTQMTQVNVNGTRMTVVQVNGTEVFRADNGNVTLVSGNSTSFNPGLEDVNRHFVILTGNFSSNPFKDPITGQPSPGPIPTINGSTGMTILNIVDNGNDDGGRAGIFTFKIPTGTGTFTVGGITSGDFAVYRVVGINSMTTAYATIQTSNNTTYSLNSSANGCGFVVAVRNFNSVTSITGTTPGLTFFPGNPGFGATNPTTSPTQSYQAYSQCNIAATFAYNLY